ncbi:DUF4062 domain-containing protein, partial [bacterium]|nr:DUF4062 domain-containing protein [bacterium]
YIFEDAPARGKSSKKTYLSEVEKRDIYIGILGKEYGDVKKGEQSPTEKEYRKAQDGDSEIIIFIKGCNKEKRDERLKKLIVEIRNPDTGYKYSRFNSIQDFRTKLHESLIDFLRDEGIVGKTKFDTAIEKNASLKEIDEDKIRWFLKTAKEKRKYVLDINTSVKDTLTHLNLLRDGKISNAAILLFGKKPKKYHLQSEIKCIQLPGIEVEKPFSSYHIYDGTLFEQIDRALSFVLDSIRMPVIQQPGTVQVARPYEIPEFVIQEAIVNAVAHRNYYSTGAVQVMVFIDRIELWNPGKLPSQLTIEQLKKRHASYPNNPLLAEVLFLAGYIQKAGSGTLEMINQCQKKGLPEPEFSVNRGEFRVVIPRDILTESRLKQLGLSDRQKIIVKIIKKESFIQLSMLKKEFPEVTDKTIYRDIRNLVEKGILREEGEKKGRKYYLK